jgi:hypothetical protein
MIRRTKTFSNTVPPEMLVLVARYWQQCDWYMSLPTGRPAVSESCGCGVRAR